MRLVCQTSHGVSFSGEFDGVTDRRKVDVQLWVLIIGAVTTISTALIKHLFERGQSGDSTVGNMTGSANISGGKGNQVVIHGARHDPSDVSFSGPAYSELLRHRDEIKHMERDLADARLEIQRLQGNAVKASRRGRLWWGVMGGEIGVSVGVIVTLLVPSFFRGQAPSSAEPMVRQSPTVISSAPSVSTPGEVPLPSVSTLTSAPASGGTTSPRVDPGGSKSEPERVIESYFDYARRHDPVSMRKLATRDFVLREKRGDNEKEGDFEKKRAAFDKWWASDVIAVEAVVTPGRQPIRIASGGFDRVWVQVAWRYATRNSRGLHAREWQLMWFNMIPSESGYQLDSVDDGTPKACKPRRELLERCALDDKYVVQ